MIRADALAAAARRLLPIAIGLFSAVFAVYAVIVVIHKDRFGIDFHYAFWPAAVRVVHGLSPYVNPHSPIVARGEAFVYPAPAALLVAPFGWLGRDVGSGIFTSLMILAIPATLWTLAVRDWRVYTIVFLWTPIFWAWETANITTLLALGVAVAWRRREHPVICGAALACVISLKIFLWPMGLWLLATRRYAALGWALGIGAVLNAVSWLVLGTGEIGRYTRLVTALTHAEERRAYSLISFSLHHGVGRPVAYAVGLSVAAAVMVACVVAGRRGRDLDALALGLAASILASPLVWLHYFALLLVPVAITRPRLSPVWGMPIMLWLCSPTRPHDGQLFLCLAVAAVMLATTLRASPQRGLGRPTLRRARLRTS